MSWGFFVCPESSAGVSPASPSESEVKLKTFGQAGRLRYD
jgi:hypothetical protein